MSTMVIIPSRIREKQKSATQRKEIIMEKEKKDFLINKIEIGQLNSLVKNSMKQMRITDPAEAVRRINSFECRIQNWYGSPNQFYLHTDSAGITGTEWIKKFKEKQVHVDESAKKILRSPDFKTTLGSHEKIVVTTEKPIGNGGSQKITSDRGYQTLFIPYLEVACLILDNYWFLLNYFNLYSIIVAHLPNDESYLKIIKRGDGFGLTTCDIHPNHAIDSRIGVAAAYSLTSIFDR